jgi:hypothetical protein
MVTWTVNAPPVTTALVRSIVHALLATVHTLAKALGVVVEGVVEAGEDESELLSQPLAAKIASPPKLTKTTKHNLFIDKWYRQIPGFQRH